jgi:hypothetical protein
MALSCAIPILRRKCADAGIATSQPKEDLIAGAHCAEGTDPHCRPCRTAHCGARRRAVLCQAVPAQMWRRCGGVRRSAHVPPGLYSRAPAVGCVANRRRRCSAGRTPAAAWAVRNHRLRRRRRRQVGPQLRCSPTHAVHAHTSRCASAACRCALQGLQRRFCAQLSAPISRGSMPFEYLSLFFSGDRFRS